MKNNFISVFIFILDVIERAALCNGTTFQITVTSFNLLKLTIIMIKKKCHSFEPFNYSETFLIYLPLNRMFNTKLIKEDDFLYIFFTVKPVQNTIDNSSRVFLSFCRFSIYNLFGSWILALNLIIFLFSFTKLCFVVDFGLKILNLKLDLIIFVLDTFQKLFPLTNNNNYRTSIKFITVLTHWRYA